MINGKTYKRMLNMYYLTVPYILVSVKYMSVNAIFQLNQFFSR